jgi:hypothetical protein
VALAISPEDRERPRSSVSGCGAISMGGHVPPRGGMGPFRATPATDERSRVDRLANDVAVIST